MENKDIEHIDDGENEDLEHIDDWENNETKKKETFFNKAQDYSSWLSLYWEQFSD